MVADLSVGREYQDHSSVPFDMFFDKVPVPQSEWFYKQNLESIPNILRYLLFGKGVNAFYGSRHNQFVYFQLVLMQCNVMNIYNVYVFVLPSL